jgi:isoquinoline 1-oxidoreductase alpha subunit
MMLDLNGQPRPVPADWHDETLLAVLRDALGLTGAKYGCGAGLCGACTVLLDGVPTRSCLVPVRAVGSRPVLSRP